MRTAHYVDPAGVVWCVTNETQNGDWALCRADTLKRNKGVIKWNDRTVVELEAARWVRAHARTRG